MTTKQKIFRVIVGLLQVLRDNKISRDDSLADEMITVVKILKGENYKSDFLISEKLECDYGSKTNKMIGTDIDMVK